MIALQNLLHEYRQAAQTEREKGTYFEELIRTYFRYEATYADYYSDVWHSDWVMERQAVTTDKKSGIESDANLWETETMGDTKYPLELFQRVITVSLETMKIVKPLPKLDID